MEETKGLQEASVVEIIRDVLIFLILFEAEKKAKNSQAKEYVSLFLKTILPVLVYETSVCLNNTSGFSKSAFLGEEMESFIKDERHSIKRNIVQSSKTLKTASEMGLDFNSKTYDIVITLKNNTLLYLNYEKYFDDINNSEKWGYLFTYPRAILTAIFMAYKFDYNVNEIITGLSSVITKTSESIDLFFSGEQYSYSVYKLFNNKQNITDLDKAFIMYRYRMISSIEQIEKTIPEILPDYNYFDIINFHLFFIKWKAVFIDIVGRELMVLNTEFSKDLLQKIDSSVSSSFYKSNRAIRNNLHYTNISYPEKKDMELIKTAQDSYLGIIKEVFDKCITIEVDNECQKMTAFSHYCSEHNIPLSELEKYNHYYYVKFSFSKIIKKLKELLYF